MTVLTPPVSKTHRSHALSHGGQVLAQVLERQGARNGQDDRGAPYQPGELDAGIAVPAQREVGDECDPLLLAEVDDVVVPAVGDVVAVLYGGDRHDAASLLDLLNADLGHPDV